MRSKIVTKRNTIMNLLVHFLASSLKNKYKLNINKVGGGGTDLLSFNVIIFVILVYFIFPHYFFSIVIITLYIQGVFFWLNNRFLLSHSLGGYYKFEI